MCAYLISALDGIDSTVKFEISDNATVEEIDKKVSEIAEQAYCDKAEWEIKEGDPDAPMA